MSRICEGKNWATSDPLGLGELLVGAYKLAQLITRRHLPHLDLVENLLKVSLRGLQIYVSEDALELPVEFRLAFRELGLSIGLHAVERLGGLIEENSQLLRDQPLLLSRLQALRPYLPLAERIEGFWLKGSNRAARSWLAHREINMVMLATSLAPAGYVELDSFDE